jgi:hypothetical protein
MAEVVDPSNVKDDDARLLREALKVLTEEIRLQRELMNLQNAQLLACRQQLDGQAEDLRLARQELALRNRLLSVSSRFKRWTAPLRRLRSSLARWMG